MKIDTIVPQFTRDWAFRAGIKFALAGMGALFVSLILRLPQPEWAVTTAWVLSTPKFVGAIGEKTVFRICGAVAGAITGYLITGSLEQHPIFFLLAMGSVAGVATSLYGGKLAPYGFRQWGYTAMLVAAQGMADPAHSWAIGMARCEEICVGIVVAMLVHGLVWPRYARVAFVAQARKTLRLAAGLFCRRAEAFARDGTMPQDDIFIPLGMQIAQMQKLLRLAKMESRAFVKVSDEAMEIVSQLAVLGSALARFATTLPSESLLREYVDGHVSRLNAALGDLLDVLGNDCPAAIVNRHHEEVTAALDAYDEALKKFRTDGCGDRLGLEESLAHAGYSSAVREIFSAASTIERMVEIISADRQDSLPTVRLERFVLPPPAWRLAGLRAAICVMIGLFFINWVHPPGGDLMLVGAFLFGSFTLESSDRRGDLRAFHAIPGILLYGLGLLIFLLLVSPLMSSYLVMNVVLGLTMFLGGYLSEKGRIGSFGSLVGLLTAAIIVGLDAQHGVNFQQIVQPVQGLVLAVILSAVVRRALWPVLPQKQLRDKLRHLLTVLQQAAEDAQLSSRAKADLSLTAADCFDLINALGGLTIPRPLLPAWTGFLSQICRLAGHLMALSDTKGVFVPDPRGEDLLLEQMAAELARVQRSLDETCGGAEQVFEAPEWLGRARREIRASGLPILPTMEAIARLYHFERALDALTEVSKRAETIHFRETFADSVL